MPIEILHKQRQLKHGNNPFHWLDIGTNENGAAEIYFLF